MSFFVSVSLELKEDNLLVEKKVEALMPELGLANKIKGKEATVTLPKNTFAGEFKGESAVKVADDCIETIVSRFSAAGIHARVFLAAGGQSWAWRLRNT